jgi:prevent-host-death family protein
MRVPVSEAKGQLTELVRRAEAGEEVILTRHGHAVARLAPMKAALDRKSSGAARGCANNGRRESDGRTARRAQPGFPLRR